MAKPSKLPEWDTTQVNAIEPTTERKEQGWLAPAGVPEKPPFQTFNYWQNEVYRWIRSINDQGILEYDNLTNYTANLSFAVGSDGILYSCKINNGPSSSVVDPVGDLTGTWVGNTAKTVRFTTSGTYSKPNGLLFIIVEGVGGGGGGGGTEATGAGTVAAARGGSGGGYSKKCIKATDLAASETVTVGAGGSGGAAGNNSGSAGGTTSFGSFLTCNGGNPGPGSGATSGATNSGVGGGTSSGGDLNIPGGPSGETSIVSAARSSLSKGGDSAMGFGGLVAVNNDGQPGGGFGSGGSAANSGTSDPARAGGDGTDGIVLITEFYGV